MAAGQIVGQVARALHPGGILIESQDNLSVALRQTERHLSASPKAPLFEATFQHDGTLVRTDLLLPDKRSWCLVEVKSATSVKDYHLQDAAIQSYVLVGQGVPLREVHLQVINKEFVYPGNGCYHEVKQNRAVNSLFIREDVSNAIKPVVKKEVPSWINGARKTLDGRMPQVTESCNQPYECPFQGFCHADGPEYPVSCLPKIRKEKAAALCKAGFEDIRDIPAGLLTNGTHEWVRQVTVKGKAELKKGVAQVINKLGYPRHYLDFETIQFAVPIWEGTRPYKQLPFQWSCHTETKAGQINHRAFLDLSGENPARAFAEELIAALGRRGPVLVYNQAFERSVLRGLASAHPDLAADLNGIIARMVDLLPITRDHYYHPDMLGSWSLKKVLPTVAPDLDYSELEGVQDGSQAQQAFIEAIAEETPKERQEQLREALLTYCQRDTEALVRLAKFFQKKG